MQINQLMVEIVVKMHDEENLHQVQIMSMLMVGRDQTINNQKKFTIERFYRSQILEKYKTTYRFCCSIIWSRI
jgi:hypothetical protein